MCRVGLCATNPNPTVASHAYLIGISCEFLLVSSIIHARLRLSIVYVEEGCIIQISCGHFILILVAHAQPDT